MSKVYNETYIVSGISEEKWRPGNEINEVWYRPSIEGGYAPLWNAIWELWEALTFHHEIEIWKASIKLSTIVPSQKTNICLAEM